MCCCFCLKISTICNCMYTIYFVSPFSRSLQKIIKTIQYTRTNRDTFWKQPVEYFIIPLNSQPYSSLINCTIVIERKLIIKCEWIFPINRKRTLVLVDSIWICLYVWVWTFTDEKTQTKERWMEWIFVLFLMTTPRFTYLPLMVDFIFSYYCEPVWI